MKRTQLYLVALISILISLSGCKAKQKAAETLRLQSETTAETLVGNVIDAQPKFSTMNISKMVMLISYKDYSFTFRGSLRVKTDSLVSVSIQPALGIEMFRIEFQPDGFAVYDKMNRRYSQNSYNYIYLKTGINVDYKAVEALFSHHIFTPQSVDRTTLCSSFDISGQPADTTTLVSRQSVAGINQRFDISLSNRIILTGLERNGSTLLSITYGKLSRTSGIDFPESATLTSGIPSLPVNATLQVEKMAFNQPILIAPINLSRYTKAALTEVISFKK